VSFQRQDLIELLKQVKSGTVQDGLDTLDLFDQSLSPAFRMVSPPKGREGFAGLAKCLLMYKLDKCALPPFENSVKFWKFLEGFVKPGDVVTVAFEGEIPNCELVGGMLGALYDRAGAVGWLGTYVRDVHELATLNMGFIAMGTHPAIARGRIGLRSKEAPVTLGGVTIKTGDYVAADSDGAVVIPDRDGIPEKMYEFIKDFIVKEHAAQADMAAGMPMSDVIDKHRIL
jgi:regulator of RNase E activity RraA